MMHKAIAIDLDGTLCRKNTFNIFLAQLLRAQSAHPVRFVRLAAWMCARKLRLISHARMKRAILEAFPAPGAAMLDAVVGEICANANSHVVELLKECRAEGFTTVLATAAPGLYAEKVAGKFGFDFCVATPLPMKNRSWEEMRGTVKRDTVLSLLANRSCELTIAVSDHSDDTPLIEAAQRPLLVELPAGTLRPAR